jgi:DNA-binding XRE family transcriptional regulator
LEKKIYHHRDPDEGEEKRGDGRRTINARMKKGLQQKELAGLLGVNQETVRRWEKDIVNPNARLKPQLVQILGEIAKIKLI